MLTTEDIKFKVSRHLKTLGMPETQLNRLNTCEHMRSPQHWRCTAEEAAEIIALVNEVIAEIEAEPYEEPIRTL